jgi:signal transduction histidine kinase
VSDLGAPAAEALSRLSNGLRSPLALIAGYADLLELRQDAETLSEAPQRIKEAAADLTRIVDDLLTVYAIEADVLYVAPAPMQAGTLADEAIALARARGTIVSLEADDGSRDTEFLADPEYAGSMISTLLENARLRAANAGATLRIRRDGGFVEFEVSDHGGAVDTDEQAVAFDRFSPLRPRTGVTTGLEFYKVRRLAELQRGRVWVADGPGDEARFGFSLPLAHQTGG